MTQPDHPTWCDPHHCNAPQCPGSCGMHRSTRLRGEFDPVSSVSVDTYLWRSNVGGTQIMFEFPGGTGDGNSLSPTQASPNSLPSAASRTGPAPPHELSKSLGLQPGLPDRTPDQTDGATRHEPRCDAMPGGAVAHYAWIR